MHHPHELLIILFVDAHFLLHLSDKWNVVSQLFYFGIKLLDLFLIFFLLELLILFLYIDSKSLYAFHHLFGLCLTHFAYFLVHVCVQSLTIAILFRTWLWRPLLGRHSLGEGLHEWI